MTYSGLSVEVRKVLEISENDGKLHITLKLWFQWTEGRLRFFNLWKSSLFSSASTDSPGLNSLSRTEVEAIWSPEIRFLNSELHRFEVLGEPAVQLEFNNNTNNSMNSIWYLAELSNLHNAYVIDGRNIQLDWSTTIR